MVSKVCVFQKKMKEQEGKMKMLFTCVSYLMRYSFLHAVTFENMFMLHLDVLKTESEKFPYVWL